jgi:hypothetical protein
MRETVIAFFPLAVIVSPVQSALLVQVVSAIYAVPAEGTVETVLADVVLITKSGGATCSAIPMRAKALLGTGYVQVVSSGTVPGATLDQVTVVPESVARFIYPALLASSMSMIAWLGNPDICTA